MMVLPSAQRIFPALYLIGFVLADLPACRPLLFLSLRHACCWSHPAKRKMTSSETGAINEEERHFSPRPAGHLLSRYGLLAVLAALLLAAWHGQIAIVILLGLILSAAGLSKLWSRFSLVGVSCQRLVSERRVFPGEYMELRLRLVNRKLLPLPWIQVNDQIPLGLAVDTSLTPSSRPGFGFLSKTAALPWYTGLSWKHRLCGNKRGYYLLGPITLTSGDIFGFYPRSATEPAADHVIVYPKIFPIAHLGMPSLHPLGETTAERRIFEDPIRVIGVRDYSPRDSRRHIHWKATARRQELQVKVFEPTTTLKVALCLAIDSFQHDGAQAEEELELGISAAASIANHLVEQRNSVGLFVNSCLADSGQPTTIPTGNGTQQLVEILEALARVTPLSSGPFEKFLQAARASLVWGTTLLFILARPSPPLMELLADLKQSGYKLVVLQAADPGESKIQRGIPWYHITQPGESMTISPEGRK